MEMPKIVTEEFQYSETKTVVEYIFPELTSVCPKTGMPDYYTVRIVYLPDKKLPELKSLKLYFVAYRNVGIWHEHLANDILNHFVEAVEPHWSFLELKVNNRGGIFTNVYRHWSKDGENVEELMKFITNESNLEEVNKKTVYI